jgi:hypothetical protein
MRNIDVSGWETVRQIGLAIFHQGLAFLIPTTVAPILGKTLYNHHFPGAATAPDSIGYFFLHLDILTIVAGLFCGLISQFILPSKFAMWVWVLPAAYLAWVFFSSDLGVFADLGYRARHFFLPSCEGVSSRTLFQMGSGCLDHFRITGRFYAAATYSYSSFVSSSIIARLSSDDRRGAH